MDEPYRNSERHREGSEMVVSDTAAYNGNKPSEKKRHHHHHHHHDGRPHKEGRGEWRDPRPPSHRDSKRY